MELPKDVHLFTIRELARACGTSRATLLRMEESGFLTPYLIDPDTGYRYYDAYNAAQVGQFMVLQTLGLTKNEIADWYYQRVDIPAFIKEQRIKLARMERTLQMLEVRTDPHHSTLFSFINLPELVCYTVTREVTTAKDIEAFFYKTHGEAIKEGFKMLGTENMFAIRDDNWQGVTIDPEKPHRMTACIPIIPPNHPDDRLITLPAARAFSLVAHGSYGVLYDLYQSFWSEIEKRGLKPAGQARFIGLSVPFVSKNISPDDYCYRLAIPVES